MQSGSEEDFEKWQLFEIGHKDNVEQLFGSSQKPSVTSLWHKNYLRLKLCRLNKSYELKKVTNCLREGLSVRYKYACSVCIMQTQEDVHPCTSHCWLSKVNVSSPAGPPQTDRRIICPQPQTACLIMSGTLKPWARARCYNHHFNSPDDTDRKLLTFCD